MTREEFRKLQIGDMVRHVNGKDSVFGTRVYIVTGNYGEHVTAVETIDMSNPPEWEIAHKTKEDKNEKPSISYCCYCGSHLSTVYCECRTA